MSARSRLADIEGPGLGKPLSAGDIERAKDNILLAIWQFLTSVEANAEQKLDALGALDDLIADATARQLREIEEGEG